MVSWKNHRRGFGALALALAAVLAGAAAPAPIEGVWKAASGGGEIELHRCDENLCGRVIVSDDLTANPDLRDVNNKTRELRTRRLKDLDIFTGFKGGPDRWVDGRIYNPDDGHTYHGKIELLPDDRVKVTGCLVFPLCGSQVWTRVR